MFQRLLTKSLSRQKPLCILGARGVGKTTLMKDFASNFSNCIHLDLETAVDRAIFNFDVSAEETLKAISFLKGKELRGSGTLIVLDEICKCPGAIKWASGQVGRWSGGQVDERQDGAMESRGPMVAATSSILTQELEMLTNPETGVMQPFYLFPLSFEEFLTVMDDRAALEALLEVPVPYYAYERLLNHFHLYALIGGMPEITSEYVAKRHLTSLKYIYEKIESRFIQMIPDVTAGTKSGDLATEVLQNTYPYAATRISFNRFGNLEKGSREIGQAFNSLSRAWSCSKFLHLYIN